MPDDERTRRRVSDETKGRIADLASGWTVDADAAPDPTPAPRARSKTQPPPPPGSAARTRLESEILAAAPDASTETDEEMAPPPAPPARTVSAPPPVPPAARKAPTAPPPPPAAALRQSGSVAAVAEASPVVAPPAAASPDPAAREPAGARPPDPDASGEIKFGDARLTAADVALLESAVAARSDPTNLDPQTVKFERGDPTALGRDEPTLLPRRARVGRLRTIAQLRRQRGILGDVRYVATVLFGVRRSRRELSTLELKQEARQQERDRYLVTLGRAAVISEGFDHPALGVAREKLGEIEDERARHHAQVGAADQELQRVTRDREARAKQYVIDLSAVDAELTELTRRLEPLNKEQAVATRKAADLRSELQRLDREIATTTASLVSVKTGKKDPAEIQAELATLKANRVATKKDEPKLAAELDSLSPRIAALDAKKSESTKRRGELIKSEEDDKRRAEELLAAIGAKRKVMDRAANDAEQLRDKLLFELADRLYVDRPTQLSAQLAPIDAIDVELGSADRRVMELREILSSVDRWKLWRGIAVLVVIVAALGAAGGWLYYMLG